MNTGLTISKDNKAMLAYDEPLEFQPAWVECSSGQGIRIVSTAGQEIKAGALYGVASHRLDNVHEVLVVRIENNQPVEGFQIPFVSQSYNDR